MVVLGEHLHTYLFSQVHKTLVLLRWLGALRLALFIFFFPLKENFVLDLKRCPRCTRDYRLQARMGDRGFNTTHCT